MAVSAADVRLIFDTDLTDPELVAFIASAGVLVGPDGCDLLGKGVTAATIDEVQKWLAAAFATANDPRVESHRTSGHTVDFESKIDLGLNSSRFGQIAMRLDPTGCLSQKDKAGRIPFLARPARASPTEVFRERQI